MHGTSTPPATAGTGVGYLTARRTPGAQSGAMPSTDAIAQRLAEVRTATDDLDVQPDLVLGVP